VIWLFACGPQELEYPLTGTVIEVRSATEVVVAHDAIPGFMGAMTMPFTVRDSSGLDPGDAIAGTLHVGDKTVLDDVRVTKEAIEEPPDLEPGEAVPEGAIFPETPVILAVGSPVTIGRGQGFPLALTFIYTRCPIPEYCPLTVARFQALQAALPEGARLLAITLDPDYDSRGVLRDFGKEHGAVPGKWDLGRVPDEVLVGVAEKAGLSTAGKGLGITHDLVMVVLDADGRVVKRYRDMAWDQAEVVRLLTPTGG
jgi:protein SCO1/2